MFILYKELWWKKIDETPDNNAIIYSFDGRAAQNVDITSLPKSNAKDWNNLDWSNTAINNPSLPTGWVDPNGVFTGCEYRMHSYQAELVHKVKEVELEARGYIKITYANGFKQVKPYFRGTDYDLLPTPAQIDYLKKFTLCNVESFMDEVKFNSSCQNSKHR